MLLSMNAVEQIWKKHSNEIETPSKQRSPTSNRFQQISNVLQQISKSVTSDLKKKLFWKFIFIILKICKW